MNKAFEKILEKMEEAIKECKELQRNTDDAYGYMKMKKGLVCGKEIVKEVAEEYNNGWIPCSERLPEEAFGCLVTVMDCDPSTQTDFENILPYFVGYDGVRWNDADGEEIPFEVITWQPLPNLYQPKGE